MQISGTTFIQVEILPDESLRLKEGLKEYVDPLKETQAVDLSSDDSNRPIYQDNTPEMMPIYENNTFAKTMAYLTFIKNRTSINKIN